MTANERATLLAGATAAALAVLMAVATGVQSPGPEAAAGHVVSEERAAPGSLEVDFNALLSAEPLALMRFDAGAGVDAGPPRYSRGTICAPPMDGGVDPGSYGIPGAIVVWGEPSGRLCDAGAPVLELWLQGRPDAPWACACSSGNNCQWRPPLYPFGRGDLTTAPLGETLQPDTWSGSGCIRKPCVELALAGVSSWPAACPTSP